MKYIKLSNSLEIPYIAYGTPIININTDNRKKYIKSHIGKIIKSDYDSLRKERGLNKILKCMTKDDNISAIDTSSAYEASEYIIGKNINDKNRKKFFIITKLSNKDQYNGNVEKALKISLKKLKVEYVDTYLMHWPVTEKYLESWKQMEQCYKKGLCKSIGVCNCNIHHLEEINKIAEIKPMINQIECHPLFTQEELRRYCKRQDILVMAYTSTARMDDRLKNTCIPDLAKKYKIREKYKDLEENKDGNDKNTGEGEKDDSKEEKEEIKDKQNGDNDKEANKDNSQTEKQPKDIQQTTEPAKQQPEAQQVAPQTQNNAQNQQTTMQQQPKGNAQNQQATVQQPPVTYNATRSASNLGSQSNPIEPKTITSITCSVEKGRLIYRISGLDNNGKEYIISKTTNRAQRVTGKEKREMKELIDNGLKNVDISIWDCFGL